MQLIEAGLRSNFDVTTPARAFNSNFTPSTSRPVLCSYIVTIESDDGDEGNVKMLSDAAATPTTVRATASSKFNVSGLIGVDGESVIGMELTYLVPIGHNVRLTTTTVNGSPTFVLLNQVEAIL